MDITLPYKRISEALKATSAMLAPCLLLGLCLVLYIAISDINTMTFAFMHYSLFIITIVGCFLSGWFNRSKASFSLVIILLTYMSINWLKQPSHSLETQLIYSFICILLPLNITFLAFSEERGFFTFWGFLKTLLIVAQLGFLDFVINRATNFSSAKQIMQLRHQLLDIATFYLGYAQGEMPTSGIIMFMTSIIILMIKASLSGKSMDYGFLCGIIGCNFGLYLYNEPTAPLIFMLGSVLIIITAVFQDSYYMAFNDQLTEIPSRQSLNADLKKLGNKYAVAMCDIDFFKKFNDTYGHDVGDQVLRMVAAKLRSVGGGGRAYRYGGEEFTILFSGKSAEEAYDSLEETRKIIEKSPFFLRDKKRPKKDPKDIENKRGKPDKKEAETVKITISIGVAEKNRRDSAPEDVIKKADRALYKAKEQGRNKVVRG